MVYQQAAVRDRQRTIATCSSVRAAAREKCACLSTLPSRFLYCAQREHKQVQHVTVIIAAVFTEMQAISRIIVLHTTHVYIALLAIPMHTLCDVITRT